LIDLNDSTLEGLNVGIDIIEIERFRNKPLNNKNASFYHSIFTESELSYCTKYSDPYPHLAGIFAAKESILKCLTTPIEMIEIEISHSRDGKPYIAAQAKIKATQAKISIAHTRSIAVAIALHVHSS
jgi:phosphopantetheine--protein transferase-like protein